MAPHVTGEVGFAKIFVCESKRLCILFLLGPKSPRKKETREMRWRGKSERRCRKETQIDRW